jgi:phytoene dehydrogenase-like protein/ligand-binding SRPBCC domain-containing protein
MSADLGGQSHPPSEYDAVVVGAGMAGLACAVALSEAGARVLVVERDGVVGGRVRTDEVDGFLLDRGFQVLLTAYPRTSALLDFETLRLHRFHAGARIRLSDGEALLADPLRRPRDFLRTLFSPAATLGDKLRVVRLRLGVTRPSLAALFGRPERTTDSALRRAGFSTRIRERFFRPYLGGIFLERDLRTSSRFFEFVMRMFAKGDAALPERGMGAIPAQLADRLPAGTTRLGEAVTEVLPASDGRPAAVHLTGGERLTARAVVVAAPDAAALMPPGTGLPDFGRGRDVTCLYYGAPRSPLGAPVLMLNGAHDGPVNNVAVLSDVAPSYAPAGSALISATVLGAPPGTDEGLDARCRAQLEGWFGPVVRSWRLLRVQRIRDALPTQAPMTLEPEVPEPLPGVLLAGDYLATPSIEGAVASGQAAARVVLEREGMLRGWEPPPVRTSFTARFVADASLDAVAAFHESPAALAQLQPPLSGTRFLRVDPLGEGSITEFEMGRGPAAIRWRARHENVEPGRGFTDVQESGPMRSWLHRHEYRALGAGRTEVLDQIWLEHPRGPRGLLTRVLFSRLALAVLFRYRAFATRRAVES